MKVNGIKQLHDLLQRCVPTITLLTCYREDSSVNLQDILQPLTTAVCGEELAVVVNRQRVLKSAELAVQKASSRLTAQLKSFFSGEDAVDEGGPKREFFR